MSYICTYHALRLDENLRPRGKMISISNSFISLNSKEGWVGNCSWKWRCEKRSWLCVFSTSSPTESKWGPGRNPLLRRKGIGERCSEIQYIVSAYLSIRWAWSSPLHRPRSPGDETSSEADVFFFCFGIFIKKSVHAPYTHFNFNGKPSQWHTEDH